jgi:hypothetical protein
MQTSANRSCDICGASLYGSIETFNVWLEEHKLAQHTNKEDLLRKYLVEEIEFLSSEPNKADIKGRLPGLRELLMILDKVRDEATTTDRSGGNTGSSTGFALA